MPYLLLQHNGQPVFRHNLQVVLTNIGRDSICDIQLTDEFISRIHATIELTNGAYTLTDKSTNGTFINDKRVTSHKLKSGDEITIGNWQIIFREDDIPSSETIIRSKSSPKKLEPKITVGLGQIVGKSFAMEELFALIKRVGPSDATICILGESGTGKELLARYIHQSSGRSFGPFVAINCGAIPENLIESELFGHEKGAFTSATIQHKGVFEQADDGTVFLDEIGEMPIDLQTRLLRVLETKEIRRVGGQTDITVNARIIAATNQDLKALVANKKFREDLFYRLYVVPMAIPPLRERKDDIPLLAEHFLAEFATDNDPKKLTDGAINKLIMHDWPGNIRELKNTLQRAMLVCHDGLINKDEIIFADLTPNVMPTSKLKEQEKTSVIDALNLSGGNTSEAARKLGISRTTLASMIKRFGISAKEFKIKI